MADDDIRVLHIDDNPNIVELTQRYLDRESDGYTVETATVPEEGLRILRDRPPDCLISDYNMPGMDGLELLRTVREEYPELPFILFTGKGSEEVASDAISEGVTDYLQKGSGAEQYELLANRIRNAVAARRDARRAERQDELMRLTEFAGNSGGFQIDVETGEMLYTDGARRILGLDDDVAPSFEEWIQSFEAAHRADIRATVDRVVETGTEARSTWRYQPTDADERLLSVTVTPATDDGRTETLRGAMHDVTGHRERERRFRALVEESNDIISVIGTDGRIRYQSPSLERILGYAPEETVGDTVWEYIHPDDRETVIETFEEWVATPGMTTTVEYRARHADGSWRWMEARGNNRFDDRAIGGYIVNSREITDRKENELELERARSLMGEIESLADVGAWEYDPDTDTLEVTAGSCRLYGLAPDADLSLSEAFDHVHPADRDLLRDRFETCRRTGDAYEVKIRLIPADGEERWIIARGERVQDPATGTVLRGYIQDVTDQQRRERDLSRYRTAFEQLPDPAVVYDREGRYELVNDAAAEMRAMSREELIGTESPYLDQIRAANPTAYQELIDGSRETLDVEFSNTFSGAGERTLECRLSRVSGETDRGGIVIVTRDVTERKAHERRLQTVRDQYRTMVEHFPDGAVFLFDTDHRYVCARGEALEAVGLSPDTVEGATPRELFPEDIADDLARYYDDALDGNYSTFEHEYGGERYRIQLAPVEPDSGDVEYGVAVSQNVTDQFERRRKLQRKNERLDEFASIVSHDLRNPLTVAEGNLELARETRDSDRLARAADALERSRTLIDDLLTLAREGEAAAESESVELAAVANRSWQSVETGSATLDVEATGVLQADRRRLQQLFENLYRNAIEHGGAEVTVRVGEMDDGFYVADTGSGIPAAEREQVFETGYSTSEDGTGFGLRIVERVADAHGWDVTVTSSAEGGARIDVTGVEFDSRPGA